MGHFDRLLEWARSAESASASTAEGEPSAEYACRGCGARFEVRYHVCPECDGFSVDRQGQYPD